MKELLMVVFKSVVTKFTVKLKFKKVINVIYYFLKSNKM